MKKKIKNSILRFFRLIYLKLIRINDTPQRVALGFGVGVFTGIMPGIGPIAAISLAFILRVNRFSALLGGILTNTWISFLTFFLSIKTGSAIMNVNYGRVCDEWIEFLRDFHFINIFKLSILKAILPVIIGYFIIAFFSGFAVYLIAVTVLCVLKKRKIANRSRV